MKLVFKKYIFKFYKIWAGGVKHGVFFFFFFFFSHTPVLCSLSGAGGCEDELAARSGSGLLIFSAAAGTGVVLLSPRRSEGGLAPGSGADYPSGGGGAWT